MRAACLAVTVVLAGCEVTATQLLVWIDTDMAVDEELDGFQVIVRGDDGDEARGPFALAGDEPVSLPASFGVAPVDGEASRDVEIAVAALRGEDSLFETRARTSFVEHERLRLDLFLARHCQVDATACDDQGLTCTRDGCVDPDVDPGDLDDPPDVVPPDPPPAEWVIGLGAAAPLEPADLARGVDLVVDAAGNVTIAVSFMGTFELGSESLSSRADAPDGLVLSVTSEGIVRWAVPLHSVQGGGVLTRAIALDPQGTVWIVANVNGDVEVDGRTRVVEGARSLLLVGLGLDGRLQGEPIVVVGEAANAEGLAVGPGGILGLTGGFGGALSLATDYVAQGYGVFAAQIDPATAEVIDSCGYDSQIEFYGHGVAFAGNRLRIVGSGYEGVWQDAGGLSCQIGRNAVVLDCAGNVLSGVTCFAGVSSDENQAWAIAEGPGRREAVVGVVGGSIQVEQELLQEGWNGLLDGVLLRRTGGDVDWVRALGDTGNDSLRAVTIGTDASVAVGGSKAVDGDVQALLVQFDDAGALLYQETFGGPGADEIVAVALDVAGGAIVVAGTSRGGGLTIDGATVLGDDGGVFVRRIVPQAD